MQIWEDLAQYLSTGMKSASLAVQATPVPREKDTSASPHLHAKDCALPRSSLLFSTAGNVFLLGMVAAKGTRPMLSPFCGRSGGLPHWGSICPGLGGRGGGAAGDSLEATASVLWFLSSVNVLGYW